MLGADAVTEYGCQAVLDPLTLEHAVNPEAMVVREVADAVTKMTAFITKAGKKPDWATFHLSIVPQPGLLVPDETMLRMRVTVQDQL
jgi:hypothetical protein